MSQNSGLKWILCLLMTLASTFALTSAGGPLQQAGPVNVRIENDNMKSFDIGPNDRTTFELVEQYRPLSMAYNPKNRPRMHASALNKPPYNRPQPVQLLIEFGENSTAAENPHTGRTSAEESPVILSSRNKNRKSEWMDWSKWSDCSSGERIRIRKCLEYNGVKCEGPNVEKQRCFSPQPSKIPFAKDPTIIEQEILGGIPNRLVLQQQKASQFQQHQQQQG